ncbi:Trk system potassium transporter TrkA [Fusibacter sp. 3D3]|uniref:Trk system potassium transporter TrkA n=1 Tax=Fusibacter sp. 3D3 TaxID=1048380 RepID=UPI0008536824|nr:Trk system potassium transporter TrkA [Fusibacter sp. 3D3]GAU76411.1 Trk system potassium uptake protein TrkA [Fusibacter sp. 3D3]
MKVMIIGAGKLGKKIAAALNGEIHVTLMDNNPLVLDRLKDHMDVLTVHANGARKDILEEMNIETYDLTIAVTSSDEANILISSMSKNLGSKRSIARIRNPEYASQLDFFKKHYNIDYVINPELSTANMILRYLMESYTFYFDDYAKGKVSVVNFNIKNISNFVNKSISDLDHLDDLVIAAISRNGNIIIPHGDTILQENDTIYVVGQRNKIHGLAKVLKSSVDNKNIRKVMILGGSKIGYYLAKSLTKKGVSVKIIESDLDRCKELSELLPNNALIIHGEGTDIDLLEEDLADMDAFIGCTGFDEENLFMSLRAKQLNIGKVIAKISRQSYVHIIEKLGIDMAINPVNITASDILKYIRGGRVAAVSLLLGGQAEVMEIIADKNLSIINKPLKSLKLSQGIIIGAIVHKGNVIIPHGESKIQAGDRVVIFSILEKVPKLKALLQLKDGL